MKKIFLTLLIALVMQEFSAQNQTQTPQIIVEGEGKLKAVPDQVKFVIAIESTGKNASEVKKENDEVIAKAIKIIKNNNVAERDFKTKQVYLNKSYDYNTKKQIYRAFQSIEVLVKDIANYDLLMNELVDAGINNINSIEFVTSQLETLKSEARKLAMKDAQQKAKDYTEPISQKLGKVILIQDNNQAHYNPPMFRNMAMAAEAYSASAPDETLAIGEIEIRAKVMVTFSLVD